MKLVDIATTEAPVLRTLDLLEAATFLHLHPQTVRRLASAGEIPAAKPGKRWVFVEQDLADWLRSSYRSTGRVSQGDMQENAICRSTDDLNPTSGGAGSRRRTVKRYADLLGLKTSAKLKSTKTD
jgi:excisionase family DNA binding protein